MTNDTSVINAAETWLKSTPQVDRARAALQQACDGNGQADIIAGLVRAGYFQPREPGGCNVAVLEARVPADILQETREPSEKRPAFWVRRIRR